MKYYEIIADVVFYLDEKHLKGKMVAGGEFHDLDSALKWYDSLVVKKVEFFKALDYFVVPSYISKDQNAVSKKYYREVVSKDDDLKDNWNY